MCYHRSQGAVLIFIVVLLALLGGLWLYFRKRTPTAQPQYVFSSDRVYNGLAVPYAHIAQAVPYAIEETGLLLSPKRQL